MDIEELFQIVLGIVIIWWGFSLCNVLLYGIDGNYPLMWANVFKALLYSALFQKARSVFYNE